MVNTVFRGALLAGIGSMIVLAVPATAQKTVHFDGRVTADRSVRNEYICVFKRGAVTRGKAKSVGAAAASRAGGRLLQSYDFALSGFALRIPEHALERMQAANPHIAYCEENQIVELAPPDGRGPKPKDPGGDPGTGSGGHDDGDPETPWGVDRLGPAQNGSWGHAFVIDSGVDLDHPDLNVDAGLSVSVIAADADKSGNDTGNGHGTHVAGTIGAIRGNGGVAGVAPGAPIVAVRVLDNSGSGSYADVIAGVDYAASKAKPGDVANMSLGGPYSRALNDAVIGASTVLKFALAAGNERQDATRTSPASAEGPNIHTIAAFDESGNWARFSNYGDPVDWAEPGVDIVSTWLNGGYAVASGTSMASPHAAGLLLRGAITADGTVTRRRDDSYPIGVN